MSRPLLFGLVALAILCFLCIRCHAPAIEADIGERARQTVSDHGLDPALVHVSGRDVRLTGTIAATTDRGRLVTALEGLRGVRVVDDGLETGVPATGGSTTASEPTTGVGETTDGAESGATSTAAPGVPGTLRFATGDRGLVLEGGVPSETTRSGLVTTAQDLWGPDRVTDRLVVDPAAGADGEAYAFETLLAALHARDVPLDAAFETSADGARLTVTGEVLSELARERTLGALRTAFPGVELIDRLTVRQASSDTEVLQARLDSELAGKIVEFETSSDRLTPRGRAVLDQLAILFGETAGRVEISGHTDSRGNPDFNLDLSRRRAEAARRYLVDAGLDADRFTTIGYGAARPIADNATAEGRQRNRRTEFRALEDE